MEYNKAITDALPPTIIMADDVALKSIGNGQAVSLPPDTKQPPPQNWIRMAINGALIAVFHAYLGNFSPILTLPSLMVFSMGALP